MLCQYNTCIYYYFDLADNEIDKVINLYGHIKETMKTLLDRNGKK